MEGYVCFSNFFSNILFDRVKRCGEILWEDRCLGGAVGIFLCLCWRWLVVEGVFGLFCLGYGGLCCIGEGWLDEGIWVLFVVVSMILILCQLFFGLYEGSSYGSECLTSQPVLCWSSVAFYSCFVGVCSRGIIW